MKATTFLRLTRSVQRSVMATPSASLDEAIAVARRRPFLPTSSSGRSSMAARPGLMAAA
jgi:hypothetical protein